MKKTMLAASVMLASTCSLALTTTVNAHENNALEAAVSSDFRQAKNSARDQYRHPEQTLNFFDIKPSDTLIELWPGGGWYAEILAPYLAKEGHYIAGNFDTEPADEKARSGYRPTVGKKFEAWLTDNKAKLGAATTVTFDPPNYYAMGPDNSADVVLTFRNLHNWAMKGYLAPVFDSAYKVLKPGGIFGIVEHRGEPGMDAKTGYMDQNQVIKLAEKAGFTFVASSEVNANSKDTKDYPKGVWTLPPRLALEEQDKEKYLAIGESDRMTLKFVKK
ncbi:methyltransferase [Shewanella schlegeliana]|uniref:Class I SAM-dependent methyltransferase n=1 Tax=Shewanella schlegeliana TaxID=190308 RepID=A0ABS1SUD1_9GAMM|nr:class I SAM-dependent methyltransferase [Shewanella schlegeliana]MBL4911935.1 class I SAM-dependent methyltransferase [Shewanella schlegeliana]MCL1110112.1 methyltransferase [Shewanella schlegeliana]GIU26802.1 methyltransferase [Shewanella schlegeliana]